MSFEEFKKYYEENKNSTEVIEFTNNFISLDKIKSYAKDNKEVKSWLDSEKDRHYNVAFETWKSNNLEGLIDSKVKELYPQKDPKDLEIEKLKLEFENMKKQAMKKEITNKAIKELTTKTLPVELIDFFNIENEEQTLSNIGKLEQIFASYKENVLKEFDKSSYKPNVGSNVQISNPWAKETFNLTKQGELLHSNPDLAKQFIAQANKK